MSRQETKDRRERGILDEFLLWLKRNELVEWQIIDRPDPPDAILSSVTAGTTWVELADIVRNDDEAKELYGILTSGESPPAHSQPSIDGCDAIPSVFINVLHKKLTKQSYQHVFETYGPGLLVLAEIDPLFNIWTLNDIRQKLYEYLKEDVGRRPYFRTLYLRYWDNEKRAYKFTKLTALPV